LAVVAVLFWIVGVCHVPLTAYLALAVYPSISLTLLRSFAEHRAAPDPQHRTVVVEANPFWRLLFLNNNLHIAHHRRPDLPWYRLPAEWQALRRDIEREPDLLVRGGYAEIAARYLLAPAAPIEHPGFGLPR
jgi:fatty acid desaturase